MNLKIAFATVGLLGVAAFSSAQVTKVGGAYQFRLKLTQGASYKYNMVITQQMATGPGGGGLKINVPFSQKVLSVAGDTATVTYSAGPITMNGSALSPKPTTGTAKISKQGKVVGGGAAAGQGVTVFPAGPIKPGATWTSPVPLGGLGPANGTKANATYKFVRVTTVDGKQVAELAVSVASSGQTKVTGSGKTYILLADGAPLKSDLSMSISGVQMQGQKAPPMKMTLAVRRA